MALVMPVSLGIREGFACEVPRCLARLIYNFLGFDLGLSLIFIIYELCTKNLEASPLTRGCHLILTSPGLWLSWDALLSTKNRGFTTPTLASLLHDALYDLRGHGALLWVGF